jgi:SAM-dependent methyltransferase
MVALAAKIAPQRSTLYSSLASQLAIPELLLSPLGPAIAEAEKKELGSQDYVLLQLDRELTERDLFTLSMLAMTNEFFVYYERIGQAVGPFLRPLALPREPFLPEDIVATRRYKGKTNELLTKFLLNAALFSSAFSDQPLWRLSVLDPLCGGGTTLFQALAYGFNAWGIDKAKRDIESTEAFLRGYLREMDIPFECREERLRQVGRRYTFRIGQGEEARQWVLAHADTAMTPTILAGQKVHLIVADLPYGVRHKGQISSLLTQALPSWQKVLRPGGAVTLAWEATRLDRQEMIGLFSDNSNLQVLNHHPYDALQHPVDRVIKKRDVVVAQLP